MSTPQQDWSSDEMKALLNQALAVEFLKLKRKEKEEEQSKSTWSSILQSVAPTIITVVIGGILGGALADHIQETNRQNDELRAWQQANLADEQKTADQAFIVIGKTVSASQDVIDIAGEGFDEHAPGLNTTDRNQLVSQKLAIWQTYNSATAAWRVDHDRIGSLLAMRHENPADINDAWTRVANSLDKFSDCALVYNKENTAVGKPVPHSDLKEACDTKRTALSKSLGDLTQLIVKARMDSPMAGSPRPKKNWWRFW
jgi:hypothetical protein